MNKWQALVEVVRILSGDGHPYLAVILAGLILIAAPALALIALT